MSYIIIYYLLILLNYSFKYFSNYYKIKPNPQKLYYIGFFKIHTISIAIAYYYHILNSEKINIMF